MWVDVYKWGDIMKSKIILCVVLVVFSFVLSGCTTETTIIIPKSGDEGSALEEPAVPTTEGLCNDGIDNDGDGCADSEDSDCGGKETKCYDNIDNDCDGLVDCADLEGCDPGACGYGCACEHGKKIERHCSGGDDNDGDGLTDCDDPDCQFGNPNKWDGADHCWEDTCNDGLDKDGDGLTDCDDPDCANDPACQ